MALQSILALRTALPFTIVTGQALHLDNPVGAWSSVCIDYGNLGSEAAPPTRAYINQVDDTTTDGEGLGDKVGLLLPLSAEGVLVVAGGVVFPQFRRPIAYQGEKRFG